MGTVVVTGALAGLNVTKHRIPSDGVALSVTSAVALLAYARRSGLSWAELGLARHRARSGGAWALAAAVSVALAYLAGVLMPRTRRLFLDSRYDLELSRALSTAFVAIPLGTIFLEEVAFRSVLWAMLARHTTTRRVALISSALFGLWHVLPSLDLAAADNGLSEAGPPRTEVVVLGTVAFTALGGLAAAELRRRSGSVLAAAGMHWATNALGVLFGLVARRLVLRADRDAG